MLATLRRGSSQLPEAPERCAGPQADVGLPTLGRPGQRSTNVGALGVEPLEPLQLVRPEKSGLGLLGEREIEAGVAAAYVVAVAALGQPLERVLADRLQHPEAGLAAGHWLRPKQVVVQERLDAVDDVELEVTGDRLGAVEGEAADEDARGS